jgi:hypothetical protein
MAARFATKVQARCGQQYQHHQGSFARPAVMSEKRSLHGAVRHGAFSAHTRKAPVEPLSLWIMINLKKRIMTQNQHVDVVTNGVCGVLAQTVFEMKIITHWSQPIECQITNLRRSMSFFFRVPTD